MFSNFSNLRLKDRILWGYSIPVLLAIASTTFLYVNAKEVHNQFEGVENAHLILAKNNDLAFHLATMQKTARGYIIAKNDVSFREYTEEKQHFASKYKELEGLVKDSEQKKKLSKILALGKQVDTYNNKLISLVNEGNVEKAIEIWKAGEGRKLGDSLDELLNDFEKRERQILLERQKVERASLESLTTVVILSNLLYSILAIAIGLWLASIISKLVQKTVNQVASASTEIATTVEQQERTIAQQASSVQQTTTTIEELGASSRQSAEQAEASAAGTRQALSLAEDGTFSVQQTMNGMETLKEKVEAIADQILRLSEQTNQIGGISGLVGDLANQTNMLALNAAVEAARAGEHGKGFGVVAGEIRKLADQSKKSADKINALVTDIQAAINTTVMVTDEGTKTVEEGIKLAQGTAETFTGVTDSINNVFLNSQQISLNAKQQAIAVQQVMAAMNSINLGAKETATGVTQIKVNAEELNQAAQKLKAVV